MSKTETPPKMIWAETFKTDERGRILTIAGDYPEAPGAGHRYHHDAVVQELASALKSSLATIEDYLDYTHDGDPWTEDARAMREMDIDDFKHDGRLDRARAALAKLDR